MYFSPGQKARAGKPEKGEPVARELFVGFQLNLVNNGKGD